MPNYALKLLLKYYKAENKFLVTCLKAYSMKTRRAWCHVF